MSCSFYFLRGCAFNSCPLFFFLRSGNWQWYSQEVSVLITVIFSIIHLFNAAWLMTSSCFYLHTIATFTGVSLVRRSWRVEPTGSRRRLPLPPGTQRPWWVSQLTARQLSSPKHSNRNDSKLCLYSQTDVDSCAHHRCGAVVMMCHSRGLDVHTKDTFYTCTGFVIHVAEIFLVSPFSLFFTVNLKL